MGTTKWLRPDASIGWIVHGGELPTDIELYYDATQARVQESIRYRVRIVHTPCTFGGLRPWFVCPGVVNGAVCGRRAAVLYHQGRYFLCRRCHGLAFTSQHEGVHDRALRRSGKLRERLMASGGLTQPAPRPRYMHWDTYLRLRKDLDATEARVMKEAIRTLDGITRRMDRLTKRGTQGGG